MKLYINLTEAMAANLLSIARHERRFPRQQAEVLLERALHVASQEIVTPCGVDASQDGLIAEVRYAPARQS
jgi:hypothetical protein